MTVATAYVKRVAYVKLKLLMTGCNVPLPSFKTISNGQKGKTRNINNSKRKMRRIERELSSILTH
jgi:hypothetical protein